MKILAVDDDPIIVELLGEVLGAFGYGNVRFANSAAQALEIVQTETVPFDCFLLDIQMPEMDGIQLTSILRGYEEYARTPILMITAMSERVYIDSAFTAGATDYITKPFELGELRARLGLIEDLVLERKQLADRNPITPMPRGDSAFSAADLEGQLHISDVDCVIDYLALENYLLQASRASMFGNCVFGVAFHNLTGMLHGSSDYEFRSIITDLAEAISESLKPHKFFLAHAGGGAFVCVRDNGGQFDIDEFQDVLSNKIGEMDLRFLDGRRLKLSPSIGKPISLDLKSPRNAAQALQTAHSNALEAAYFARTEAIEAPTGLRSILKWIG